ncbi:MAG: hypothetical protein OXE78_06800 [Gammaproteobacteria bacterium]|nr:hypothetical protein [Gammaproteobacteria bacterium]
MEWTTLHGSLLAKACESVLGTAESGALSYIRCLTSDVIEALGADSSFIPENWKVHRVADKENEEKRTITADKAVELRESKNTALLLLVDTNSAGAGMDGIYSAAQEINETILFDHAHRLASNKIKQQHSTKTCRYAQQALKKARGHGNLDGVSRWAEFDFLCQVAAGDMTPGAYLHLLGLWAIKDSENDNELDDLNTSRLFVDRLLGPASLSLSPAARIEAIRLDPDSERKPGELESFLLEVDAKPILTALERLSKIQHLWIGTLKTQGLTGSICNIDLISWRSSNGKIAKWSGLIEEGDAGDPPTLILRSNSAEDGSDANLVVKWKADPPNIGKNSAEYRITVKTDKDEELAEPKIVSHSARKSGERCQFSNDDFTFLDENALLSAKVTLEVVGENQIARQETEEFIIRCGEPRSQVESGVGARVRTFSEGLAYLENREDALTTISSSVKKSDSQGFVLLRTPVYNGMRKSFRVFRPSLIAEVEKQWYENQGVIGRWEIRVRSTGDRAGEAKFIPIQDRQGNTWERAVKASRKMAKSFSPEVGGGVAQVYDQENKTFSLVHEYLLAWAKLLEEGDPELALAHTVEVLSLSESIIGLIVLPAHPLRVVWQVAYDNLVLDTAFEKQELAQNILKEFSVLDGAMFPAFLPNPRGGAFIFADTLGFHALGMVPESNKEPKAAVALLERALGFSLKTDGAPTIGRKSAEVLGKEITKYLDCHKTKDKIGNLTYTSRLLYIHALRAGDGQTIARALGYVQRQYQQEDEASEDEGPGTTPVFSLDIYPSDEQRDVGGRFIADAREKRRSGAGVLASEDQWMLESLRLSGGVNLPRLRWSRKEQLEPKTVAHLAIAFDTFESQVVASNEDEQPSGPNHAFGLLSFYERNYSSQPSPIWLSSAPSRTSGEKHPARHSHTDMLNRIESSILGAVVRHLGAKTGNPTLKTEVSPEKADSLADLHRLCDWVITLDRNAGIEYFDSPLDNQKIYDAYVIDCVPEREDLGCLQLVTSTSNLDEVRYLFDAALDQMGLSRSRRNAEFLLENLKALSGRLAIKLTGHLPPTSELIALAISHSNCRHATAEDECWVSLKDGFIVPVDDIRDLLPPLTLSKGKNEIGTRPDLIYVTNTPRKGLNFCFIEVKYRRHLRAARAPELLEQILRQTKDLRSRWDDWYGHIEVCDAFRAIRRAKLSRVLRFYADKAHRHYLPTARHKELVCELDNMLRMGREYAITPVDGGDRGWIFCAEYTGHEPLMIAPENWETKVFLFGPRLLPDVDMGFNSSSPQQTEQISVQKNEMSKEQSVDKSKVQLENGGDQPENKPNASAVQTESLRPVSISVGNDILSDSKVEWPLSVKGNPHLLISGLPGMGKTTCLVNLCKQLDEASIRPIVFSYHQDIDERLTESLGDISFVDFDGLGFNPLQIIDQNSRMAHLDIAGAMRDIFTAIYPELGDIQADRIRTAIKDSFVEVGWGSDANAKVPAFKRFVEILRSFPKPDRGLLTLLARLSELDDYGFFGTDHDSRDSLWDEQRPTVIRIHTTQNENLQRAFAFLVFYGLYKDMFRRGIQERITHALVFDEAHRASRLNLIPTMAKECRKYGISLVLASQEAHDFDTSVFSAVANYLVLRLTDKDAKFLVRNVSSSRQERALIDRIKQLDRFKALYFAEGNSRPSLVALPP